MSRLVNADGSDYPETQVARQQSPYRLPTDVQINATAVAHPPVAGLVGRFQASAYGSPSGHGCYVVDTMTGKTWHVANGQPARVVAEGFVPQATPTQSTWLPPDHQSPVGSVVVPTPSNSERSLFRESAPVPQSKSVVEPTPTQTPEPSDAD
ncbi:MAG: hypothetical protein JNL18_05025 [Planctomycetaceae bacterium]|nr:hypothetical protein [Planctomycetaceae bacterium]